jgi:tetratricopeptide (TPR) repeat protein
MESQISELQGKQARMAEQSDPQIEAWVRLCDVLGRLGQQVHRQGLPLFDQWVAEEPSLWHYHLARGVAHLHAGQLDKALADLQTADRRLREFNQPANAAALVKSVQAYALSKRKGNRDGDRLFAEAKKLDRRSWRVLLVSGWSNLERKKYSAAKADLQMALQLSKKTPQADTHEAMALLLAACPVDRFRDADKAIEHAKAACKLAKERDWIYLDTLGAAHAEAGDFGSALKSAEKALACAPDECQEPIRQHIALYHGKKPYRWN